MPPEEQRQTPPVCDYEGSDYQSTFWDQADRQYEDKVEEIALRRLLPPQGDLLLETGAGAGRNTPRYTGFKHVVVLDYSLSQIEQARRRLGADPEYIFVVADAYRLPFVAGLFDTSTMIRVIHHMSDAPLALHTQHRVLAPGGTFILEFANKRNIKSITRYLLRRQAWDPFSREPVEFAELNFDFHPRAMPAKKRYKNSPGYSRANFTWTLTSTRVFWISASIGVYSWEASMASIRTPAALPRSMGYTEYPASEIYRARPRDCPIAPLMSCPCLRAF